MVSLNYVRTNYQGKNRPYFSYGKLFNRRTLSRHLNKSSETQDTVGNFIFIHFIQCLMNVRVLHFLSNTLYKLPKKKAKTAIFN
jgi:hypothetical protein